MCVYVFWTYPRTYVFLLEAPRMYVFVLDVPEPERSGSVKKMHVVDVYFNVNSPQ